MALKIGDLSDNVGCCITVLCIGDKQTAFYVLLTCISTDPCNENILDALFILSLFRKSTSTCFGHICSPSSGGILYIYSNWYVMCFSIDKLTDIYINKIQQDATVCRYLFTAKSLYMFRVSIAPIIRST